MNAAQHPSTPRDPREQRGRKDPHETPEAETPEAERVVDRIFKGVELLTVPEVAAVLRVSKMTVYRKVHNGELPSVHFGRSFRIPASAMDEYLPKEWRRE